MVWLSVNDWAMKHEKEAMLCCVTCSVFPSPSRHLTFIIMNESLLNDQNFIQFMIFNAGFYLNRQPWTLIDTHNHNYHNNFGEHCVIFFIVHYDLLYMYQKTL